MDDQFSIPGTKPSRVQTKGLKRFSLLHTHDSMNITYSSCLPIVWQFCIIPLELLLWKVVSYTLI